MNAANRKQKFQDWFTQQWTIFRGRQIAPDTAPWLMGPFGKAGAGAGDIISTIAEKEGLIVERNKTAHGLIPSINTLNLSEAEIARLSKEVVDFYENTWRYKIAFTVKWNPYFKVFGRLVGCLFSKRLNQLNIPTGSYNGQEAINSEIITLSNSELGTVKYTIWHRTFAATGKVLFSGVYTTCALPSGKICIKVVFPLPNGNATVIMAPSVGADGELHLDSSGKRFGDPGFYFLLNDAKGQYWSRYIRSFHDRLVVRHKDGTVAGVQYLTLWGLRILQFTYQIYAY